jgi:hypothetical protein
VDDAEDRRVMPKSRGGGTRRKTPRPEPGREHMSENRTGPIVPRVARGAGTGKGVKPQAHASGATCGVKSAKSSRMRSLQKGAKLCGLSPG